MTHLKRLVVGGARWLATPTGFFCFFALVIGLTIGIFTRPFAGDDEQTHFARSYAITRGDLMLEVRGFGVGSDLPGGVVDEMTRLRVIGGTEHRSVAWKHWNADIADGPDEFVSYPMATLSPVGHMPSAIGIGFGRLLGASPFVLLLLARFANLFFYIAVVAAVLRVVPVLRWPLAWIGVFPSVLFVAANASPDAFAVAMVIAAIGLALLIRDRKLRDIAISKGVWCAVFATALGLGNAKAPYFLTIGVFALPWLRSRGNSRILVTAAVATTILAGGIWATAFSDRYVLGAYVGSEHASPIEKLLGGSPHPGALDPTLQWERLRGDPSRFLSAGWHMAAHQGDRITSTALFDYGLWLPPWWVSFAAFAFLAMFRFSTTEADRARFSRVERSLLWVLLALLGTIMLLSLFVYDTVTDQQTLEITGMQGRYLAPLLPLLMIAIPAAPRLRISKTAMATAQAGLFAVLIYAVTFGVYPSYFVKILRAIPQ